MNTDKDSNKGFGAPAKTPGQAAIETASRRESVTQQVNAMNKRFRTSWKDNAASTAEQIEVSMRKGNSDKLAGLNAIREQCQFVIACSTEPGLVKFAKLIDGIAMQASV